MAWSGLLRKRAIPAWLVGGTWVAIEALDWFDRWQSVLDKLKAMAPFLGSFLEFMASGYARIGVLVLGLIAIYFAVRPKQSRRPSAATQQSVGPAIHGAIGPDVVLLPPADGVSYRLDFVPLRALGFSLAPFGWAGTGDREPQFRIKNLGLLSVTDIVVKWAIGNDDVEDIFLASELLRRFRPTVGNGFFWLHGEIPSPNMFAVPVADKDETRVPFCPPTPTSDASTAAPLPGSVANSLAIRLIASRRPEVYELVLNGPDIRAEILYMVGTEKAVRLFRVRTRILYLPESSGQFEGDALPQHASELNFRGNITFGVDVHAATDLTAESANATTS